MNQDENYLQAAGWQRLSESVGDEWSVWADPLKITSQRDVAICAGQGYGLPLFDAAEVQRGRDAAVLAERERIAGLAEERAASMFAAVSPWVQESVGVVARRVLLKFAEELRRGDGK